MTIVEQVQRMLEKDSSLEHFGIEVLTAGDGRAQLSLTIGEAAANGHRIAHGGVIFALADSAFACAVNSVVPGTATAGASITYYRPARVGDELTADAQLRHLDGRHSLVDVTVSSGAHVVAEYRGRGAVLRRETRPSADPCTQHSERDQHE